MTTRNTPTKILLVLLLSILLLPVVTASFTNEWGEYQDHYNNRGYVNEIGHFTSELGTTYSTNMNASYQPLIADVDNDGTQEIIIMDRRFLQLRSPTGLLLDELTLNLSFTQPTLSDLNNNNLLEIHAYSFIDDYIYIYEYNGTNFNKIINHSIYTNGPTSGSGLKCSPANKCYLAYDNGTEDFVFEYNLTEGTAHEISTSLLIQPSVPAIEDIDNDGIYDMVVIADDNGNKQCGIAVIDLNGSGAPHLKTSFSGDGIIDDISDNCNVSNPIIYNIDGAGHAEIILANSDNAAQDYAWLDIFRSSGANYGSFPQTFDYARDERLAITMANFGDNNREICGMVAANAAAPGNAPYPMRLRCFSFNGSYSWEYNWSTGVIPNSRMTIISADMDDDGIDEIITPVGILERGTGTGGTIITNLSFENHILSVSDIDGDGSLEIVGVNESTIKIVNSNFNNEVPNVWNNLSYGGYGNNFGYSTPICINSTVTYSAQENGGIASANYDNDATLDTERIVTNCGQLSNGFSASDFTTNIANGTYDLTNPQFSCYFNQTGTFNVRLYLQDDQNDNNFTQYNTQTIVANVIDGTSGSTCNLISSVSPGDSSLISVTIAGQDDFASSTQTIVNMFTGSNETVKLWIGMVLLIGLMITMYMLTKSFGITTLVSIIGVVFGSFIGFFPIWIAILVMVILIALAVLSFSGGVNTNGGT